MRRLIAGLIISSVIGTANAMATAYNHIPQPTPAPQHVYVHHNSSFDRSSYIIGGAMIGVTAIMLLWVLTDRYVDPTHYSVQF